MTEHLEDKPLACIDCDTEFLWTAGEQAYYANRGLQTPRRCKPCRVIRRQQQAWRDEMGNGDTRA
jgi:hypothetical protein